MLVALHSFFRNLLHCIDFSGQTMLHKTHVSKTTATKQAKWVKVFKAETFCRTGLLDHVHGGTRRLLLLKVTGTNQSTGRLVWCNKALLDGHLCFPVLPFVGLHFNWLINDLWSSAHLFRWYLIDSCFANMPNLKWLVDFTFLFFVCGCANAHTFKLYEFFIKYLRFYFSWSYTRYLGITCLLFYHSSSTFIRLVNQFFKVLVLTLVVSCDLALLF